MEEWHHATINLGDTIAIARQADSFSKGSASELMILGERFQKDLFIDTAIATFQRVLEMQPTNAMAHLRLAYVLSMRSERMAGPTLT